MYWIMPASSQAMALFKRLISSSTELIGDS
jgi:hypothetical protein